MKVRKENLVTRKETVTEKIICDLCGKQGRNGGWGHSMWDVLETEVSICIKDKQGKSYPEGGSGYKYEIDLCPVCFREKLVPWLESQGANLELEEWDW